jgi:lipopolysaccharide/colanic/teichoic acid biosynthesis glycosyltransferase
MTLSKRLFDLCVVLALIVVFGVPILLLLGVLLIVQGRPVFYISERMKAPGQPFWLWKLRTMTVAVENSGVSGGDKAARITPIGRFLRSTRLDEVPQLWNILRGDISFVGPRPPLRIYVERFPALYARVLQSRPGVTGLATLRYHAVEERLLAPCTTPEQTDSVYCSRCIPRKAQLDLLYQRNWSLCLDMSLMWETLKSVLLRRVAQILGGNPR